MAAVGCSLYETISCTYFSVADLSPAVVVGGAVRGPGLRKARTVQWCGVECSGVESHPLGKKKDTCVASAPPRRLKRQRGTALRKRHGPMQSTAEGIGITRVSLGPPSSGELATFMQVLSKGNVTKPGLLHCRIRGDPLQHWPPKQGHPTKCGSTEQYALCVTESLKHNCSQKT